MLDAGADLLVRAIVLLLPVGEFAAGPTAVRHHESGAGIAAVGDGHRLADGGFGPGFLPCLAVVSVAWKRLADHDDQAGVRHDHTSHAVIVSPRRRAWTRT